MKTSRVEILNGPRVFVLADPVRAKLCPTERYHRRKKPKENRTIDVTRDSFVSTGESARSKLSSL